LTTLKSNNFKYQTNLANKSFSELNGVIYRNL